MTTVLISYDLRNSGRKYDDLYTAIRNLGNWCHPLESTWIVVGPNLTAKGVRDTLGRVLDSDDGLLCVETSHVAAWRGLVPKVDDWIVAHL